MAKPSYPATLNTSDALASGLLGFWLMNEGGTSTIAHDSTATANNGIISSDVSWTTGDGSDPVLSFPATATANLNVLDLGSSAIYVPTAITVAVRFRADSSFAGDWQHIFGRGLVYVGWSYVLVLYGSELRWYVAQATGAGPVGITTTKDVWHTAVAVMDPAVGHRLYIDSTGDSGNNPYGTSLGAGTYHLSAGRGSDGAGATFPSPDSFGGLISYLGIWNRAFSSTDRTDFLATPFRMFSGGGGPIVTPNFVGGSGVPGQVPANYAA
jgi:hypothetical protein